MMHTPWHQPTWHQFIQLQRQKRLPHALLLTGPKGLAKTELALQMARFQLCLDEDKGEQACGHCHSCQLFDAHSHPDHLFIEPEEAGKTIKIDQIRALKAKQALTSSISKWKTVIVHPAHKMTISASNSLLKLLEEPESNTLLLLVGSQPESLPITIRSRCQRMHLAAPDKSFCQRWLADNAITFSDEAFSALYTLANGAPLAMQALYESGAIEHYQQITADFERLMEKPVNPVALSAAWQQFDLQFVLRVLLFALQQKLVKQVTAGEKQSVIRQNWTIADCILTSIKLISSQNNYNKTLLIEDFIVSIIHSKKPNKTVIDAIN